LRYHARLAPRRLPTLLLLTIAGVSIANRALWAMAAGGDGYVSLTAPEIAQHQLGLLVTGPSPDLLVQVGVTVPIRENCTLRLGSGSYLYS
jgi:hypothetical protein